MIKQYVILIVCLANLSPTIQASEQQKQPTTHFPQRDKKILNNFLKKAKCEEKCTHDLKNIILRYIDDISDPSIYTKIDAKNHNFFPKESEVFFWRYSSPFITKINVDTGAMHKLFFEEDYKDKMIHYAIKSVHNNEFIMVLKSEYPTLLNDKLLIFKQKNNCLIGLQEIGGILQDNIIISDDHKCIFSVFFHYQQSALTLWKKGNNKNEIYVKKSIKLDTDDLILKSKVYGFSSELHSSKKKTLFGIISDFQFTNSGREIIACIPTNSTKQDSCKLKIFSHPQKKSIELYKIILSQDENRLFSLYKYYDNDKLHYIDVYNLSQGVENSKRITMLPCPQYDNPAIIPSPKGDYIVVLGEKESSGMGEFHFKVALWNVKENKQQYCEALTSLVEQEKNSQLSFVWYNNLLYVITGTACVLLNVLQ